MTSNVSATMQILATAKWLRILAADMTASSCTDYIAYIVLLLTRNMGVNAHLLYPPSSQRSGRGNVVGMIEPENTLPTQYTSLHEAYSFVLLVSSTSTSSSSSAAFHRPCFL